MVLSGRCGKSPRAGRRFVQYAEMKRAFSRQASDFSSTVVTGACGVPPGRVRSSQARFRVICPFTWTRDRDQGPDLRPHGAQGCSVRISAPAPARRY